MRRTLAILTVFAFVGCASAPPRSAPTYFIDPSRWPENLEIPPDADSEPLPEGLPPNVWSLPYECDGKEGVCISPALAARYLLVREGYKILRRRYEADRRVWKTHRKAYEDRIDWYEETLESMKPSWWEQNGIWISFTGGLLLGVGASIAILSASP